MIVSLLTHICVTRPQFNLYGADCWGWYIHREIEMSSMQPPTVTTRVYVPVVWGINSSDVWLPRPHTQWFNENYIKIQIYLSRKCHCLPRRNMNEQRRVYSRGDTLRPEQNRRHFANERICLYSVPSIIDLISLGPLLLIRINVNTSMDK